MGLLKKAQPGNPGPTPPRKTTTMKAALPRAARLLGAGEAELQGILANGERPALELARRAQHTAPSRAPAPTPTLRAARSRHCRRAAGPGGGSAPRGCARLSPGNPWNRPARALGPWSTRRPPTTGGTLAEPSRGAAGASRRRPTDVLILLG